MHTPNGADMPCIQLGPHRVSRLILGGNPVNGGSHLSRFLNLQMKRYFTPERITELLARCEEVGVNTWQTTRLNMDSYQQFRALGGQMQFIALANDDALQASLPDDLAAAGAIGAAHHGEYTDVYFKTGRMGLVQEYCKKVRQAGLQVGVSTHIPEVVDYIESAGWDVDFYMCCVYQRHRTRQELTERLGDVPIPVKEVYLEGDPARMFRAMRQTEKPCLAFKILAAGRLCDNPLTVERAFETTFRQIKPNDAVIVGMYPEYEDQPALNAAYVRRFSALSGQAATGLAAG